MIQNIILNRACFKEGMQKLETVFQDKKVTEEFLKIYYERLNYCKDKRFIEEINNIIDNEQWFPTIKVFLNYLPEPPKQQKSLKEIINE